MLKKERKQKIESVIARLQGKKQCYVCKEWFYDEKLFTLIGERKGEETRIDICNDCMLGRKKYENKKN